MKMGATWGQAQILGGTSISRRITTAEVHSQERIPLPRHREIGTVSSVVTLQVSK